MVSFHRPSTLDAAIAIRAAGDVMVLAGGTDVYPARAARVGWGDGTHKDVLDISRLADLRGITHHFSHWRIGALTTWSDVIRASLPPLFDGLRLAAREIGGVQIQNRGTLVGNICTASPAGDGVPNLLALDASVELASRRGTRRIAMADFIDGYRHTVCAPDEIVTAILVPHASAGTRGHFLKLGARRYLVISIVMAAGVIETGHHGEIVSARIAIGACSPVAQRLYHLETALTGQPLATASESVAAQHFPELHPVDDIRASASYRRHAARQLTRDLLSMVAASAHGRAA